MTRGKKQTPNSLTPELNRGDIIWAYCEKRASDSHTRNAGVRGHPRVKRSFEISIGLFGCAAARCVGNSGTGDSPVFFETIMKTSSRVC